MKLFRLGLVAVLALSAAACGTTARPADTVTADAVASGFVRFAPGGGEASDGPANTALTGSTKEPIGPKPDTFTTNTTWRNPDGSFGSVKCCGQ